MNHPAPAAQRFGATAHYRTETKTRAPPGPGYVCHICHVPGHWKESCPHATAATGMAGWKQPRGPPGRGYVCHICHVPGHWKESCPNKTPPRSVPWPRAPHRGHHAAPAAASESKFHHESKFHESKFHHESKVNTAAAAGANDGRPVCVIDAANIGRWSSHITVAGGKPQLITGQIVAAVDLVREWGMRPVALVPQFFLENKRRIPYADDVSTLRDLEQRGVVEKLPNSIDDDVAIIRRAKQLRGYVLTNDQFRDHQRSGEVTRPWMRRHVFTFSVNKGTGRCQLHSPDDLAQVRADGLRDARSPGAAAAGAIEAKTAVSTAAAAAAAATPAAPAAPCPAPAAAAPAPAAGALCVHKVFYQGKGKHGDYAWMLQQPKYDSVLHIYNENLEQYRRKHDTRPGGGNACARAYRPSPAVPGRRRGKAIGIPTGSRGCGFRSLQQVVGGGVAMTVQRVIDQAIQEAVQHVLAHPGRFKVICYCVNSAHEDLIGQGVFSAGDDVRRYITRAIKRLPETVASAATAAAVAVPGNGLRAPPGRREQAAAAAASAAAPAAAPLVGTTPGAMPAAAAPAGGLQSLPPVPPVPPAQAAQAVNEALPMTTAIACASEDPSVPTAMAVDSDDEEEHGGSEAGQPAAAWACFASSTTGWTAYGPVAAEFIEAVYQSGTPAFVLPGCHVAPGNAFEYRICFRRMKQVNLTTGAEREIRRHA